MNTLKNMLISQKQIDQINKCFTYKGGTFCCILQVNQNEIHISPNEPWDIEWADLKLLDNSKFSLTWKWKGVEKPFIKNELTFSEVKKYFKFYRG